MVVHTYDAPRSGRPIEAATPEIIDKVHDIVLTDRRACGHRHITWHSNFNFARTIGYEKAIGKMSAAFAMDHKRDRVTISKCLEMF